MTETSGPPDAEAGSATRSTSPARIANSRFMGLPPHAGARRVVTRGPPPWHGAVPDNTFVHLAVTATGGTEFHEAVDDATYRTPPRP